MGGYLKGGRPPDGLTLREGVVAQAGTDAERVARSGQGTPTGHDEERHGKDQQVDPVGDHRGKGAAPTEHDRPHVRSGQLPPGRMPPAHPTSRAPTRRHRGIPPGSGRWKESSRGVGVATDRKTSPTTDRPLAALIHSSGLMVMRWARTGSATALTSSGVR